MEIIKTYAIALVVFFLIDIVWLVVVARKLYQQELGFIMSDKPNWVVAALFYLIFIAGLVFFVINPSLEKNSFFSISTALNLQGLSDFRSDYIFVSKERSTRIEQGSITLNQENIDNAFSKKPRRTNAYDKIDNHIVVLLEANNTDGFGIVEYDRYRVSSINRAFVEMITNIHYFQSSQNLIQVLENIKNRLDIDKIYTIIEKFDFIYPYFQLAGFYLEKIGFPKVELEKFYTKRSELNFYTQKNKNQYGFDGYWKIYY